MIIECQYYIQIVYLTTNNKLCWSSESIRNCDCKIAGSLMITTISKLLVKENSFNNSLEISLIRKT
jgi:hypothetical protein